MCGFILIHDLNRINLDTANNCLSNINHRGPDNSSYLFSDDERTFLGHTRLSIIDLNPRSNQPKKSISGKFVCAFNGEIYNFKELVIRFNLPDICYSDTDVLLEMFERFGIDAFSYFDGMFSGVIYDLENFKIYLFRDRFGIKPLYYFSSNEFILACSEIPPIINYTKKYFSIKPDIDSIFTYLSSSMYDHNSSTFFESIVSLNPGTAISFSLVEPINSLHFYQWYSLKNEVDKLPLISSYSEAVDHCFDLVSNAVKANMVSDVNVGLNVSGGIDSSLLAFFATQLYPKCYQFNQNYPYPYSELEYINVKYPSQLLPVNLKSDDIYNFLHQAVKSQAEPFGGVTVIGYYYLYKYAKSLGTTVFLDGNGVDEAFMGYSKYSSNFKLNTSIDGSVISTIDFIEPSLVDQARLISPRFTGFEGTFRESSACDLLSTKIPRGLRFNDRASMYNSCELRVPFLNHSLIEFAFSLPLDFLINQNHQKLIFRDVVSRCLSNDVAYAPKRHVQSPQREWIASEFQPLLLELISSSRLCDMNFLNKNLLFESYKEYCGGSQKNSFAIWQFLNLELWARAYL